MGNNCACLTSKENENDLTLLNDKNTHLLCKFIKFIIYITNITNNRSF